MKKVTVEDAVGQRLGHDITEVNLGKNFKRSAFKRGHVVQAEDIEHLKNLGKNHLFVMTDASDERQVHEDDAAMEVAPRIAGENISYDPEPKEGKIGFYATCKGLFSVDVERLYRINALAVPSLPTLHTGFPVNEGKQVAAFRIIPLTCDREIVDSMLAILDTPLFSIKPFLLQRAGIIVTGTEVYEGRVEDAFVPKISRLLKRFDVAVEHTAVLPDNKERITKSISEIADRCDIVFVTGGTSVDPDDQTAAAMRDAGVVFENKGNPVQPGNNLTIGYRGETIVCAVPAAAIFFKATALDIFLPKLLIGERISQEDIFRSGHGGLCHFCKQCHYPVCPFGVCS